MATEVQTTEQVTEDRSRHDEGSHVGVEDVAAVGSRIGWGAIFAGAVVAMAVYLVLTLLGTAIGLTVSNDVRSGTMGMGAAIWAIITTIVALFAGGWVTSQGTVGESKTEAVIYGIIMWGVFLFLMLWLVSVGMRTGFSAMWGAATFASASTTGGAVGDTVSQDPALIEGEQAGQASANQTSAAEYAAAATWYTLLGTLLSMAAAIGGALVGAGPSFRLLTVPVRAGRRAL